MTIPNSWFNCSGRSSGRKVQEPEYRRHSSRNEIYFTGAHNRRQGMFFFIFQLTKPVIKRGLPVYSVPDVSTYAVLSLFSGQVEFSFESISSTERVCIEQLNAKFKNGVMLRQCGEGLVVNRAYRDLAPLIDYINSRSVAQLLAETWHQLSNSFFLYRSFIEFGKDSVG